jgi:hypothetical protein
VTKSKLVEVAQSLGEVVGEVLSLVQRNEELQTEVLRLRGLKPDVLPPPEGFPNVRRCVRCATPLRTLEQFVIYMNECGAVPGLCSSCVEELKK